MNLPKLAISYALFISLAANCEAQNAAAVGLRQPGALTPTASPTGQSAKGIQQPVAYTAPQPVASMAAPIATEIQQPARYAPTEPQPSAQVSVNAQIQQPGTLVSPAPQVAAAPMIAPPVVQPAPFTAATETPTTAAPAGQPPAAVALLQQPSAVAPAKSSFANYYHDDEDEDDDESDDDDEDDDDSCSDKIGCGDAGCERNNTCCGFELGGWMQQGFTYNPYDPADGNNGTVILNDLANQWMMNQLWFYANRDVDNGGCGWDWGARFDVLFGTDAEYFQMVDGLEDRWGQNGQYQVAILRFYYDVAYNDWTFRVGRWDTPVGYEPFDATESFFYSRSYNFYAQPGSLLGMFLTRHLNDQWSVSAGLHRGDMQFDDTDGKNALGFIGGFSWDSTDEKSWFDAYIETDEEGPGIDAIDYSLIAGTALSDKWDYVCEWYYGQNDQFGRQSNWYGLNQHFIREINDCWSHGFRFEWFRDDDGFIITDFLRGNSAQGPFNGNFFEVTYAINYQPCENFVLRPEIRYDWFDASSPSPRPFDDGTKNDQFLLSLDAIYAF